MESKINLVFKWAIIILLCIIFPVAMGIIILVFTVLYFLFIKDAPVMPEDYDEPIEKVDERSKRDENNELN